MNVTSSESAAPIGIFDSGVGGLSVLREIATLLPSEELLYVADSAFGPYGERSVRYIEQRCVSIAEFLISMRSKALVVACNTATAAIAPLLRRRFTVPIVAIEPAVKPAASLSRTGVIGVLATRQTLTSERFSDLIAAHAATVEVLTEPCPELVDLVELGMTDGVAAEDAVGRKVRSLLDRRADVIVLGCTHFHFLRPLVESIAAGRASVIDPGVPVARELSRRLAQAQLLSAPGCQAAERIWISGQPESRRAVIERLLRHQCEINALPAEYCRPPTSDS